MTPPLNHSQKKRLALKKARKCNLRNAQADERAGCEQSERTRRLGESKNPRWEFLDVFENYFPSL